MIKVSIIGAIGGPCSGHLAVSQVILVEELVVGQLNSLSWLWQTCPVSPEWDVFWQIAENENWRMINDHDFLSSRHLNLQLRKHRSG